MVIQVVARRPPVLLHEGRVVLQREEGRVVQRDAVVHHGSVGQSEMERER